MSTEATPTKAQPFADWLRETMDRCGYPTDGPRAGGATRLAGDSGVSQPTISRALAGGVAPDLESLRQLAPVLRVPLRDLLIRSGRVAAEELAEPADVTPRKRLTAFDLGGDWQIARRLSILSVDRSEVVHYPADALRFERDWVFVSGEGRILVFPAWRVVDAEIDPRLQTAF